MKTQECVKNTLRMYFSIEYGVEFKNVLSLRFLQIFYQGFQISRDERKSTRPLTNNNPV